MGGEATCELRPGALAGVAGMADAVNRAGGGASAPVTAVTGTVSSAKVACGSASCERDDVRCQYQNATAAPSSKSIIGPQGFVLFVGAAFVFDAFTFRVP